MSPDTGGRDQFAKAYEHVCDQLAAGAYAPGERLPIADIASKLGLSPTPVREALSRLAGEGLIRDRRGDGYYATELSGDDIATLYALQVACLETAFRSFQKSGLSLSIIRNDLDLKHGSDASAPTSIAAVIFRKILVISGNRVLISAGRKIAAKLKSIHTIEHNTLLRYEEEHRDLLNLWHKGVISDLRKAVIAYHRRRQRAAHQIGAELKKQRQNIDEI